MATTPTKREVPAQRPRKQAKVPAVEPEPPRPAAGPRKRPTRTTAHATYAREESASARPSRKSTRKSANRSKPDNNLARRNLRKVRSPAERAGRASAEKPG